jgi:hypothetical protein
MGDMGRAIVLGAAKGDPGPFLDSLQPGVSLHVFKT